jgi:hypothetical protein
MNSFIESNPDRAKAICVLSNSILFLSQFFLIKEETTGRYVHVRLHDLDELVLCPKETKIQKLAEVFNKCSQFRFKSIRDQLDQDYDERYEVFWAKQKDKHQTSLFEMNLLVNPSKDRLQFDIDVCEALDIAITKDDLIRIYTAIIEEMIITKGLVRD